MYEHEIARKTVSKFVKIIRHFGFHDFRNLQNIKGRGIIP